MSKEKDHNFKSGEWFYALDGAVYEFIDDNVGSRKICEVVDLEKTAFMSDAMKKRGYVMAAAPDMYKMLETIMNILNGDDELNEVSASDIDKLLAKARG